MNNHSIGRVGRSSKTAGPSSCRLALVAASARSDGCLPVVRCCGASIVEAATVSYPFRRVSGEAILLRLLVLVPFVLSAILFQSEYLTDGEYVLLACGTAVGIGASLSLVRQRRKSVWGWIGLVASVTMGLCLVVKVVLIWATE